MSNRWAVLFVYTLTVFVCLLALSEISGLQHFGYFIKLWQQTSVTGHLSHRPHTHWMQIIVFHSFIALQASLIAGLSDRQRNENKQNGIKVQRFIASSCAFVVGW